MDDFRAHLISNKDRLITELSAEITELIVLISGSGTLADAVNPLKHGVTRLLYTEEWEQAQQGLAVRMAELGLEAAFDDVGNLFGKLQGENREQSSILTGSHIDTVTNGGLYDGAYGIAAGLIAVSYLRKHCGIPRRTLEVVSLCEEEGSRFPLAYWGSGSIAGLRNPGMIERLVDREGVSFREAMERCGFGKGDYPAAMRHDIGAFFELHIEQGPWLEREEAAIGVVRTIAGQRRWRFEVNGEVNHAGTTPMLWRKDALDGAAAMITQLRTSALQRGAPLVATIGQLEVFPNVPNVIPGKVAFTVDIRHDDEQKLHQFSDHVQTVFRQLAMERGLAVVSEEWVHEQPAPLHPQLVSQLQLTCNQFGSSYRMMMSGAGHDAQIFQTICPSAMLFVPSEQGISHSPEEYTNPRALAEGVLLLIDLLYRYGYKEEWL